MLNLQFCQVRSRRSQHCSFSRFHASLGDQKALAIAKGAPKKKSKKIRKRPAAASYEELAAGEAEEVEGSKNEVITGDEQDVENEDEEKEEEEPGVLEEIKDEGKEGMAKKKARASPKRMRLKKKASPKRLAKKNKEKRRNGRM